MNVFLKRYSSYVFPGKFLNNVLFAANKTPVLHWWIQYFRCLKILFSLSLEPPSLHLNFSNFVKPTPFTLKSTQILCFQFFFTIFWMCYWFHIWLCSWCYHWCCGLLLGQKLKQSSESIPKINIQNEVVVQSNWKIKNYNFNYRSKYIQDLHR